MSNNHFHCQEQAADEWRGEKQNCDSFDYWCCLLSTPTFGENLSNFLFSLCQVVISTLNTFRLRESLNTQAAYLIHVNIGWTGLLMLVIAARHEDLCSFVFLFPHQFSPAVSQKATRRTVQSFDYGLEFFPSSSCLILNISKSFSAHKNTRKNRFSTSCYTTFWATVWLQVRVRSGWCTASCWHQHFICPFSRSLSKRLPTVLSVCLTSWKTMTR